jgi:hypothetical protein
LQPDIQPVSAALAGALSLVPAAGALAASPKPGKLYTGPTSASYNGFTAPVSFTVSKNGRQLVSFKWAGGGCIGLGGPGNEPREQLQARDAQCLAHRRLRRQKRGLLLIWG